MAKVKCEWDLCKHNCNEVCVNQGEIELGSCVTEDQTEYLYCLSFESKKEGE